VTSGRSRAGHCAPPGSPDAVRRAADQVHELDLIPELGRRDRWRRSAILGSTSGTEPAQSASVQEQVNVAEIDEFDEIVRWCVT